MHQNLACVFLFIKLYKVKKRQKNICNLKTICDIRNNVRVWVMLLLHVVAMPQQGWWTTRL